MAAVSDAESVETNPQWVPEEHPDQADWPEETAAETEEGADAEGGEAAEPSDEDEEDEEEDEEEDADFLRVRENDVGDGVLLTIVSLPLPPAGVPGGRLRRQTFVFQRQLEEILYGATSGTYTGAIHRAIEVGTATDPSALAIIYHALTPRFMMAVYHPPIQRLNLDATIRPMERKEASKSMAVSQWADLLAAYQTMNRRAHPLAGPAKRMSLVPVAVAAALARDRKHAGLLKALGHSIPKKWAAEKQKAALAEANCIDYNVEAVLEATDDCDELMEQALSEELASTYEPYAEVPQDEATSRSYALKKPSGALKKDLEEYRRRRTSAINRFRRGRAVEDTTCDGDVSNALRFLGWFRDHRDTQADAHPSPPLTLKGVWSDDRLGAWVEEYTSFLEGRKLKWSSKANYCTGLINVLEYAISSEGYTLTEERGLTVHAQLLNIRRQCDGEATIEKMYRRKHKDWLDWPDVQRTRLTALDHLRKAKTATQRHAALEDALMVSLFSVTPPDRVGVIRRLMIGVTLRRIEDDPSEEEVEEEEDEVAEASNGYHWWIDLTAAKHKTSRFYGPSMVRISDLVAPLLEQYLESKTAMLELDFGDDDEAHEGRYLFSRGSDHRALTISQWTAVIKAAFGRHSPNGEAPPPKLLRSSFITFLRSSERAPEVLKSAAGVMKHAVNTSASDVYDTGVHEKLLSASFTFCEDYARSIESEVTGSASSNNSAKGKDGKGKGKAGKASIKPTKAPNRTKSHGKAPATPVKVKASRAGPKTPAKGKRRASEAPPPPTPPEAAALVGRAVHKRFEDEWYAGTIESYLHPYLKVVYEDGDVEEADVDQARRLVSGVDVGVRVQYHFGSELGWIGGEVTTKYRRGFVIFEPDELAEDSTSSAMAWQVQWDDGDLECVDLCLERQSTVAKAGNWQLEPAQRN